MHINWQKTLLITLDVALATYLGFAFTKFNKPDEKGMLCTKVNINIAADVNGSADHEGSGVRSCIALYSDFSALHTSPVTTVGCTQVVFGISVNDELATGHTNTAEGINIALDMDFST